ncbi:MAG: polysaccharide export protein [Deltaproteobacteria bacterium]|nr:polysaccharide export protein [Deltaproteobacteria bacterium]
MRKQLSLLIATVLMIMPLVASAADYVIGEGDGLDIAVWGVKDLTFPAKVRPDGKITVPGLGDVQASGLTPANMQAALAARLKTLVKNPIVTVSVSQITNSKVYIFGGGIKSGVMDLHQRITLLQLLCMLGETKTADLKKAYLLRNGKKIKENFHRLFIDGDISDDMQLESGDSIFIPLVQDKNVYVLGAVNLPKAIDYRDGMRVMEAILEAGGFTKFASQNDTQVRRKEAKGDVSIPVRAKEIISSGKMEQNIKLNPGDYVIVKESIF